MGKAPPHQCMPRYTSPLHSALSMCARRFQPSTTELHPTSTCGRRRLTTAGVARGRLQRRRLAAYAMPNAVALHAGSAAVCMLRRRRLPIQVQ